MFLSSLVLATTATTILHTTGPSILKCPDVTFSTTAKALVIDDIAYTEGAWIRGDDSLTIEYNGADGSKMYVIDGRHEYDLPNGCSYSQDPAPTRNASFTAHECPTIEAATAGSLPDGDPQSIVVGPELFTYSGSAYADGFMENEFRSKKGHFISHTIPESSRAMWTTDLDGNCSFDLN